MTTADLDQNWAKEHQVTILGLTIELDGTVYKTVGQDQLTSPELLEAMKNGAKQTTSQVNVGQFQETFEQFAKEGKDLLYVAFSSVLSGTYQSANVITCLPSFLVIVAILRDRAVAWVVFDR